MRAFSFAVACFCTDCRRNVWATVAELQSIPDDEILVSTKAGHSHVKKLALLLLTVNPANGWQLPVTRCGFNSVQGHALGSHVAVRPAALSRGCGACQSMRHPRFSRDAINSGGAVSDNEQSNSTEDGRSNSSSGRTASTDNCSSNSNSSDSSVSQNSTNYDPDVQSYLRKSQNALGRKVAILLPSDLDLEHAMLLAARKLVKLGAAVRVIKPDSDPRELSTAYPRVEQFTVNVSSVDQVAHALWDVDCLVLGADLPAGVYKPLEAALALNAAKDSIVQLVVLSSVAVYGNALPGVANSSRTQDDWQNEPVVLTEDLHPQPRDVVTSTLLAHEMILASLTPHRCAVLRSCPVYDDGAEMVGGGMLSIDSLLGDMTGLQELLEDILEDLGSQLGSASLLPSPTDTIASLLPPADTPVQMTHLADLASACVFAFMAELKGIFHICSAPGTLQQLLDSIAARKEWDPFVLRKGEVKARHIPTEGDSEDGASLPHDGRTRRAAYFSNAKIREAGYELLWPEFMVARNVDEVSADKHGEEASESFRPSGRKQRDGGE